MSPREPDPRRTATVLWLLCAAGGLGFLGLAAAAILYPYQSSYVEGYLLEQAQRLASGGALYGPLQDRPWLVDNFPPVYPWLLAAGTAVAGPSFAFGRILTVAAVAGSAWLAYRFHRDQRQAPAVAAAWMTLWLVSPFVLRRAMLVRMDFAAILLVALGVLLVLRWKEKDLSWPHILAVAGLFLAAGLVRQTLVAAPLAVLLTLWTSGRRRAAFRFAAVLATGAMAAVAVLQTTSDGGFLQHTVLYNTGRYSLVLWAREWGMLFSWQAIVVILGAFGAWRARHDPNVRLLAIWWALAFLTASTVGKPGSTYNHFLELLWVSGLLAPIGLQTVTEAAERVGRSFRAPTALATVLGLQLILSAVSGPVWTGIDHVSHGEDDDALVAALKAVQGPVLSENAGAVVQAGHGLVIEPRTLLELTLSGAWEESDFVASILAQEYSVVVLETFPPSRYRSEGFRFSPAAWDAIQAGYAQGETLGRYTLWWPVEAPA